MAPNIRLSDGALASDQEEDIKFTLRLPRILHARIMSEVKKRQVEFSRYSAADWIKDTIRQRLDGPTPMMFLRPVSESGVEYRELEEGEGGSLAPTQPPIQPSQFLNGYWDKWSRDSKRLEGEAKQESFNEALRDRVAAGLKLPDGFMKKSPESRMGWLRANDRG